MVEIHRIAEFSLNVLENIETKEDDDLYVNKKKIHKKKVNRKKKPKNLGVNDFSF